VIAIVFAVTLLFDFELPLFLIGWQQEGKFPLHLLGHCSSGEYWMVG
jgi:hypothetical protein